MFDIELTWRFAAIFMAGALSAHALNRILVDRHGVVGGFRIAINIILAILLILVVVRFITFWYILLSL